ncbi:MFS transporter [Acidithrix ferrooxidans]|uniref:Putative transporter n=1 Tax=Acidithrix ferrooxidans TaxID=1280514 RepID=A0A0D8HEB8_9ACTN|nr:MFS transporter [Acidithrix ferrooxidans]KJF16278.1 putative transporter [Acidithrix ferrooxidans]
MTTSVTDRVSGETPKGGSGFSLTNRRLESYPEFGPRMVQLAIVVLVTIALYYELYVGGSVTTILLPKLGMSFTFYVTALAFGNLIGAFGSLAAGLSDRLGRANIVVAGLLITGLATAFVIPSMTSKWSFVIATYLVGIVEGIALVATPALIRDFSPQTGRATAMGLWTTGPVLGSLVVSVVGSTTITATTQWPYEYRICGIVGLVIFVIALFGLRELSPNLRDQLMVSVKDRVLIEARAKGIDIEASLKNPWRQMLKADIIISAVAVSILLLIYYTAVAFGTVLLTTVFGFSLKNANGIANWQWAANAIALILVGIISDKVRVRKPFMIVGGIGAIILTIVFIFKLGHTNSYYEIAFLLAGISIFLAFAYAPWMASFTETVEARNPALTATGLAVWGWILRVIVFVAFLVVPAVVNSATPLVEYGAQVQAYATQDQSQLAFAASHGPLLAFVQSHGSLIAFAQSHPTIIQTATTYSAQLADAQKFAPELAVIEAHPAIFTQLAGYSNPATIPPALLSQALTAAGGGAKGGAILASISANKAAIEGVIAVASQLQSLAPYATQLKAIAANATQFQALSANASELGALQKASSQLNFLKLHAPAVQSAAKQSPKQWQTWYWICAAACVLFLASVPLMRGRWSPKKAKEDEDAHEAMVAKEMENLHLV